MKIYGIYNIKDNEQCIRVGTLQDVDTNRMTINELVQAVKQLDKKIERSEIHENK